MFPYSHLTPFTSLDVRRGGWLQGGTGAATVREQHRYDFAMRLNLQQHFPVVLPAEDVVLRGAGLGQREGLAHDGPDGPARQ